MKAMVLAAGLGERMRPLTDKLPKPLLEVGGKPLLAWHLEKLAAAGVREVVINVAHLGEMIVARFGDGADYGLRIAWSREAAPLGTAGGIATALPLLGDAPFLLINADVHADYDLSRLTRISLDRGGAAHLVLVPNPEHHPRGDFSLSGGRVGTALAPRYTYSGIAQLSPRIVAGVAAGSKALLGPLLHQAAAEDAASGELHRGLWCDVGTPQRLSQMQARLAQRKGEEER